MFGVGYLKLKALFLEYLERETAACDTRDVQKYVSHIETSYTKNLSLACNLSSSFIIPIIFCISVASILLRITCVNFIFFIG